MKLKDTAYGPDCVHCNLIYNKLSGMSYCPKNPSYRCVALSDDDEVSLENRIAIPAYLASLKNEGFTKG